MLSYRFQIDSALTTQAVLQRIRAVTRDTPGTWQSIKESFSLRAEGKVPFIGDVEGSRFRLRRDIRYRNSFLPQVRGRVQAIPGGTRIFVTMRLHPLVCVFTLVWLGVVGVACLSILARGRVAVGPTLVPFGMFAFGVALATGGFYPEAVKARRILEQSLRVVGA